MGPEAQTIEHLRILETLGVTKGIIVLSRIDLVDEESREILMELVDEFRSGTFLEGCPILPVNSISGDGVPELKAELDRQLQQLTPQKNRWAVPPVCGSQFYHSGPRYSHVTGSVHSGHFEYEKPAGSVVACGR